MNNFVVVALIATAGVTLVNGLEPYENFRESSIHPSPVKASREFVDSLRYYSGGSRYSLYRIAALLPHPNYRSLREDQFYYDSCFTRNTSSTTSGTIGAVFGFGRILITFKALTRPGIYIDHVPVDPSQSQNRYTDIVTLTDNQSFAVVVRYWPRVDRWGWQVLTRKPNLDSRTQRIVEEHVAKMGFKRENFTYLRYDSCRGIRGGNH